MDKKKDTGAESGGETTRNLGKEDGENTRKAHREADKDISSDPEYSAHSPNDDLDEGESARVGRE